MKSLDTVPLLSFSVSLCIYLQIVLVCLSASGRRREPDFQVSRGIVRRGASDTIRRARFNFKVYDYLMCIVHLICCSFSGRFEENGHGNYSLPLLVKPNDGISYLWLKMNVKIQKFD